MPSIPLTSFTPAIRTQIETAYRKARSDPADGAAAGRLGMLLHAYQQVESAEVCYRRARALDSADARWVYYLGLVQAALGKHVEAAAAFGEVVRRQPGYPAARLNLAESLLAAGRLDESAAAYEAALQKDPTSAAAHYGFGRVESARRRAAQAVEHYRKACELSPAFGSAHYALAAAYRDLGDSARAQEEFALYQKHRLGFPPRADPWLDAVEDSKTGAFNLVKRGIAAETAGEREASIREHERALELDPNYIQAHLNLISLYGKAGRPDRAEEHYRAALRLNPNLDELHYNYGVLLVSQGKEAEAAEAFRRALEINPNYAEAHGNYAYILMTRGNVDEAERHYREALDNKPNYRLAHFNLGRLLVHRGKTAEAIEHFRETLAPEDEETPGYLYALGAAYARLGDRARALEYIRAAREKAAAAGQKDLLASITRDLEILEQGSRNP